MFRRAVFAFDPGRAGSFLHRHPDGIRGGGMNVVAIFDGLFILADGPAPGAPASWQDFIFGSPIIPVVLTFVVFFLFFTRQDMKKQKEQRQLLSDLKKNDSIVTVGGVCGTIVNIAPGARYVTIRVDDTNNTRLRILRSAISAIDSGEEAASKKDEK